MLEWKVQHPRTRRGVGWPPYCQRQACEAGPSTVGIAKKSGWPLCANRVRTGDIWGHKSPRVVTANWRAMIDPHVA